MTTPRRAGRQCGGDLPPPLIIILCRTLIIIPRRAGQGPSRFPPGSRRCAGSAQGYAGGPACRPLGRHPPHLPPPRPVLRRDRRLAALGRRCRLTASSRGTA